MVSRKKAAGKARKAVKAKAREKAREEQANERIAARLRELSCKHGADPSSSQSDSLCIQFVRAFHEKVVEAKKDSHRHLLTCLLDAQSATMDEFADVWYDSAMETAMSVFLSVGTQNYLIGNHGDSRYYATVARFFEQIMTASKQSQAYQNWPKLLETHKADLHTLVKFFRHRIPCSCLDEKYEEVKSITKLGFCYNPDCKFSIVKGEGVERSKAKYCSRCRCVTYCSRECQVACWTEHKPDCE